MGNFNSNFSETPKTNFSETPKTYHNEFLSLEDDNIKDIRLRFKVIDVDWLDLDKVNYEMFADEYFEKNKNSKLIVNDMVKYHLEDKDKAIYKKTDYLCNRKEKICVCNVHAEDFRKIYGICFLLQFVITKNLFQFFNIMIFIIIFYIIS